MRGARRRRRTSRRPMRSVASDIQPVVFSLQSLEVRFARGRTRSTTHLAARSASATEKDKSPSPTVRTRQPPYSCPKSGPGLSSATLDSSRAAGPAAAAGRARRAGRSGARRPAQPSRAQRLANSRAWRGRRVPSRAAVSWDAFWGCCGGGASAMAAAFGSLQCSGGSALFRGDGVVQS